jgi:phage recombination protein Bet
MSNLVVSQATSLAKALSVDASNAQELIATLKATAFKGQVSDAQMAALLIVAQQYGLNPWTKEIYAFPDRNNGIVPVVGVDGWSRIINSHPQFDGMQFQQDEESCTCTIFRKDRKHPVSVTEFMSECKREGVGPWKSHPKRMLRHKATIQCARLAFGFVGIYEQDEAERIVDAEFTRVEPVGSRAAQAALEQITPQDSPEREAAIKEATDVAGMGVEKFRAMWKAWPTEKRQLVTDKLAQFQEIAERADAEQVTA